MSMNVDKEPGCSHVNLRCYGLKRLTHCYLTVPILSVLQLKSVTKAFTFIVQVGWACSMFWHGLDP